MTPVATEVVKLSSAAIPPAPPPPTGVAYPVPLPGAPGRRRLTLVSLVTVGVVLAGLVGYFVLAQPGHKDAANDRTHGSTTNTDGNHGSTAPSASANPNLDSCLVGKWAGKAQLTPEPIDGHNVIFASDRGPSYTFLSNGTGSSDAVGTKPVVAVYKGNAYETEYSGTSTFHWQTRDGQVIFSQSRTTGTYRDYENGNYVGSGPLHYSNGSLAYRCVGSSTLTLSGNGGALEDLQRSAG